MKVIRIEYLLNDNNWKCNILAKDAKDAIGFLESHLKAEFRIMSTEEVCEIHGISSSINDVGAQPNTPTKKLGRPPKN